MAAAALLGRVEACTDWKKTMARNEDSSPKSPRERGLGIALVRVARTEASEIYIIWQEDVRLGQIDLHFGFELIHGTLVIERDLSTGEIEALVDQIDLDVVSSHLPQFAREDFIVTVFRGQEIDSFSDGEPEVDEEEDADEDY